MAVLNGHYEKFTTMRNSVFLLPHLKRLREAPSLTLGASIAGLKIEKAPASPEPLH